MKIKLHPFDLPLQHPFAISRGSITHQRCLVVELQHAGVSGFGEVTENRFYGHTIDSISASLQNARGLIESFPLDHPDWPSQLWSAALQSLAGDRFALSALDIAAHDLSARLLGVPLYQAWGLDWIDVPNSSYTIGIAPIAEMVSKLAEQPGWSIYKIKLGTPADLEIIRELRQHTLATFRVDANCGWTAEQTIRNAAELRDLGVEFIEQPLPIDATDEDKRNVFQQSALPLIADEDCQVETDVDRCQQFFHGVNVKLCKCGGLTPALRMLRHARELGLKTMVGCMIESSVGISAASQLLPLLDYADLDGAVLLAQDPCSGVTVNRGDVQLTNSVGTGAAIKQRDGKN